MPAPQTYSALEIEEALLGLVWHQPGLLPNCLQKLVPDLHLSQPNKTLLETILYCSREMGACDWATVIEALRQLGELEACGDKVILDQIYSNPGFECLLSWYIEILADYASARTEEPPRSGSFFSGGKGQLTANKARTGTSADVIGVAVIAGKPYSIRGWSAKDFLDQKFIDLRFYPK